MGRGCVVFKGYDLVLMGKEVLFLRDIDFVRELEVGVFERV